MIENKMACKFSNVVSESCRNKMTLESSVENPADYVLQWVYGRILACYESHGF